MAMNSPRGTDERYATATFLFHHIILWYMDILLGKSTKWHSEVPYGYEAFLCLSEADKRGLAPQDIVLLSYPLTISVLRRRR